MRFVAISYLVVNSFLAVSQARSEPYLSFLLDHLEYDAEIKGLFLPKGYFDGLKGSLYIGSAKIKPSAGGLYCFGWQPALHLDSISYGGSSKDFFAMAKDLAKKCRSDLYLNRLKTHDGVEEESYIVSKSGTVKPGL